MASGVIGCCLVKLKLKALSFHFFMRGNCSYTCTYGMYVSCVLYLTKSEGFCQRETRINIAIYHVQSTYTTLTTTNMTRLTQPELILGDRTWEHCYKQPMEKSWRKTLSFLKKQQRKLHQHEINKLQDNLARELYI